MITLKKKARFYDFDYGKPSAKHPVESWILQPGKAGTRDEEPGVGLLIATDLEYIELVLLRSEIYELLTDLNVKYGEECGCEDCTPVPPVVGSDCSDECCPDIFCPCGDCKGCYE